jgi:hypothetical protein
VLTLIQSNENDPKCIHLERVNDSLWRVVIYVEIGPSLARVLGWLKGHGLQVCRQVVEHGHLRTKTIDLDSND